MKFLRSMRLAAVVAVISLLAAGCTRTNTDEALVEHPLEVVDERSEATDGGGSIVDIRVVGVIGYPLGDLAGVVMQEADGLVVGGFATRIDGDPFTTVQRVLRPAQLDELAGPWPPLTDEDAVLTPGEYVLSLWVDTRLGGYTRWFPQNSDRRGLAGCVQQFRVGDDAVTEIVVGGDVQSTGYVGVCEPPSDSTAPPPIETTSPPTNDAEVFSFADDDLCEWLTGEEVAALISAVYAWDGTATIDEKSDPGGCTWLLSGPDGYGDHLAVGDASQWLDIDGNPYDVAAQTPTDYTHELEPWIDIGATVSGHPDLSKGVVVHNGAYGQYAFWAPPSEQYLAYSLAVPGVEDVFTEGRFFAVANDLLRELGWTQ
jgi:hypothetical protein